MLAVGEFSVFGGNAGVDFDPNADAFVRYDRETDTLHLRLRGGIDVKKLDLQVDTNGFFSSSELVDTTIRLNDAIDFRRTEFLGGDPNFGDFLVTDFLFRTALRANERTSLFGSRLATKAELVAQVESQTSAVRILQFNSNGEVDKGGAVQFEKLNALAVDIRGLEEKILIDQEITYDIDLINLIPTPTRTVTINVLNPSDPADSTSLIEILDPVDRRQQFSLNHAFKKSGPKLVTVVIGNEIVAEQAFAVFEPESETGRPPGDPLVGQNKLLKLDPFDISLIGGFNNLNQESFIRVGAFSGSVSPNVTSDVTIRVSAFFLTDPGRLPVEDVSPTDDFNPQAQQFSAITTELETRLRPVDAQIGRRFTGVLEQSDFSRPDAIFADDSGSRMIDRMLLFELLGSSGTVLDTIELDQGQLQRMRADRGNELPDDYGQRRPLDIDIIPTVSDRRTLIAGEARAGFDVTVDNLISNLGAVVGKPILRIDFGDGSPPEVFEISNQDQIQFFRTLDDPRPDALKDDIAGLFSHLYTRAGEFDVTATITLPNGLSAGEQTRLSVLTGQNVFVDFTASQGTTFGNLDVQGTMSGTTADTTMEFELNIDGFAPTTGQLTLDGFAFNETLPLPDGLDVLIPDGKRSTVVSAVITLQSTENLTTRVPFEFELFRKELEFDSFQKGQDSLVFLVPADVVEIDVPLLVDRVTAEDGTVRDIPEIGTIEVFPDLDGGFSPNNLFQRARNTLPNSNSVVGFKRDDTRDLVIRSFTRIDDFDTLVLTDTSAIPPARLDASHVTIGKALIGVNSSLSPGMVAEGDNFAPFLAFFNIRGNVVVEVDHGDGVFRSFNLNLTFDGALATNFRHILEQVPGGSSQATFPLRVRVLQGGTEIATATREFTILDHGLVNLEPLPSDGLSFDFLGTRIEDQGNVVAEHLLEAELTVRARETYLDDVVTATVFWGDGTSDVVEMVREGATENLTAVVQHSFQDEFLLEMSRRDALGREGSRISLPGFRVELEDNNATLLNQGLFFVPIQVAGIEVVQDPTLLDARVEAENGALLGDRKVTVNQPVEVAIVTGFQQGPTVTNVLDAFLNLEPDHAMQVDIQITQRGDELGGRSQSIRLIKNAGETGSFFRIENSDGSLSGRVPFERVPIGAPRFSNVDRIRLVDLDTGESIIRFDATGRYTLDVSITIDGLVRETLSIGQSEIAVFPTLDDVVAAADGTLDGFLKGFGDDIDDISVVLPENGERLPLPVNDGLNPNDPRFVVLEELELKVREGGRVIVDTPAGGNSGRLLLPLQIGDPQFSGILLEAPEFVDQDEKFALVATLPQSLINRVNVADGFFLFFDLDLGDGRRFEVHIIRTEDEGDPVLASLLEIGEGSIPILFTPADGRLVFFSNIPFLGDRNGPLISLNKTGPQNIQMFGQGSFGNTVVNVSNVRPSVTPALAVDPAGRLVGQLRINSPNGVELQILGKVIRVPPGNQVVNAEDIDPNDGRQFQAGDPINTLIVEDGGEVATYTFELTPDTEGNKAPQLIDLTLQRQPDGTVTVQGTATDPDSDPLTVSISDQQGTEAGTTIPDTDGRFTIVVPVAIVEEELVVLELSDSRGSVVRLLLGFDELAQLLPGAASIFESFQKQPLFPNAKIVTDSAVEEFTASVSTEDGMLTIAGSNNPPLNKIMFSGTTAEVENAIRSLEFTPNQGLNGRARFVFEAEDTTDPTLKTTQEFFIDLLPTSQLDFGDAPTPYPTSLTADGARHIATGPMLGQVVDTEADGVNSDNADGDDISGATPDDEDGVVFGSTLLAISDFATTANVLITASETAKLDAWIDFNGNGNWDDAGEQIFASRDVEAGVNTLGFTVPAGASVGTTAARFRISTAGGLLPTGQADDGEVEDYLVKIVDDDTAADVSVQLPGGETSVTIEIPDEAAEGESPANAALVVRTSTQELLRVPPVSVASIRLSASPQDDIVSLMDLSAIVGRALTVFADGGDGNDTLQLLGADFAVDLTGDGGANLQNFETFDIIGDGKNSLKLDADQVVRLSPATGTLLVRSDPGDSVEIGEGWGRVATEVVDGEFVRVVSQQAATLRLIGPDEWSNPVDPHDVNNDGSVSALDALTVINELNRQRFSDNQGLLVPALTTGPFPNVFFDVNRDARASAIDALRVINFLNRRDVEDPAGENLSTGTSPTPLIAIAIANHAIGQPPPRSDRAFDNTILPAGQSNQKFVAEVLTEDRASSTAMVDLQKEREIMVDTVLRQMDDRLLPEQLSSLELRNSF